MNRPIKTRKLRNPPLPRLRQAGADCEVEFSFIRGRDEAVITTAQFLPFLPRFEQSGDNMSSEKLRKNLLRMTPCTNAMDDSLHTLRFASDSLLSQLNIDQPNNGQTLSTSQDARPRYTGERLLRERPKIYRQVVRLLGEG